MTKILGNLQFIEHSIRILHCTVYPFRFYPSKKSDEKTLAKIYWSLRRWDGCQKWKVTNQICERRNSISNKNDRKKSIDQVRRSKSPHYGFWTRSSITPRVMGPRCELTIFSWDRAISPKFGWWTSIFCSAMVSVWMLWSFATCLLLLPIYYLL